MRYLILILIAAVSLACGDKEESSEPSEAVGETAAETADPAEGEAAESEAAEGEAAEGEAADDAPPTEPDFEEQAIEGITGEDLEKMVDELEKEIAAED